MATGGVAGGVQRLFVSYAGADAAWAEWVAWTLEAAGHETLIQAWDFVPGSRFVDEMQRALDGSRQLIAVLSDAYLTSAFSSAEWQAAFAADPDGAHRLLLVVRVEDCARPGLLRQLVSVDLFGVDREVAKRRLLAAVAGRRGKPDREPAFPAMTHAPPTPTTRISAHPRPRVRSAYREQVRQIAPPRLIGREAELDRLAGFCLAPDDETSTPYLWWRAEAWTGKSALLATFVLDPPPEIRVVSFFVTARYAGNSDLAAFVEIVTEQLAELLGESIPPYLDPARQQRLWFRLFADAAEFCRASGQRLVLVVDGLDEDRGVTGPGARSIAALLPANPPAGARVVVAGRPDPPIPGDVPVGHPLRDPAIIRPLRRSDHAAAIKADMQADLGRLRSGSPLERDLLGLVAAAEGGLSDRDLEDLSADPDVTAYDIEMLLSTVAGRSFASRPAQWKFDGPKVYLLGHEDLQQDAVRAYGPKRLEGYRERLHAWASVYQQRRWPADTPEYLLRGYYRLLLTTGDLRRAVDCATDTARYDRMLDLSGGDTTALAEITDAQNAVRMAPVPDLRLMARLAVHRYRITQRNSHIPSHLPAVWARLGHTVRAEQLARGITDPYARAEALAMLPAVLAEAGEYADAVDLARSITRQYFQGRALADVTVALADAGEHAEALHLARTIDEPDLRAQALADVTIALARSGASADAVTLAHGITDDHYRVGALAGIAIALSDSGAHAEAVQLVRSIAGFPSYQVQALTRIAAARARENGRVDVGQLIAEAEHLARSLMDPYFRARALAEVAVAVASCGDHARVAHLAKDAEQVACSLTDPDMHAQTLTNIAATLAAAGVRADTVRIARGIDNEHYRGAALAGVAVALIEAGEYGAATQLVRYIDAPLARAKGLATLTTALLRAGAHAHARKTAADAEQVARRITEPEVQARVLADIAVVLSQTGDSPKAEKLAREAEQIARSIGEPIFQAFTRANLATALAKAGDHLEAEKIARSITYPYLRAEALTEIAVALVHDDHREDALRLARSIITPDTSQTQARVAAALAAAGQHTAAEQLSNGPADPGAQCHALVAVATVQAEARHHSHALQTADHAEQAARRIAQPDQRARALANIATVRAQAKDHTRARRLAAEAEQLADTVADHFFREPVLAAVAAALARAGQHSEAEALARSLTIPDTRATALAEVAIAPGRANSSTDAERIALSIDQACPRGEALTEVAVSMARSGRPTTAHTLTQSITEAYPRARAQAKIAIVLAEARAYADAERLAHTITNHNAHAEALIGIATTLARNGNPDQAARLLAEALSIGDWPHLPLSSIATINPAAAQTIAAASLADQDGTPG